MTSDSVMPERARLGEEFGIGSDQIAGGKTVESKLMAKPVTAFYSSVTVEPVF
ncbi:MAG: hypothetical protein M2R45_03779 [Verrucomicrobia subdivision 3 bacterium]|nr:hypothetical protein [Limisphaerales bacterium]MCS1416780.1 hypothetical protein [Limisphaerales bacterium]